jgi:hypothetical protein
MIFISYRRSDTPHLAIRIYEKLVEQFGPSTVFIDTESIEYGDDFPSAIRKSLSECLEWKMGSHLDYCIMFFKPNLQT